MKDKGFGKTILSDLQKNDLFYSLKRDLTDVCDFYLDRESKERLARMNKVKRGFVLSFWLVKGMFFKLTSARRLLLLVAFVFALSGSQAAYNSEQFSIRVDFRIISFVIVLVILMLELMDKLLAHDELLVGKKVQAALMPTDNPELKGWDVWLYTRSANEVSGDLVDYLAVGEGKLGVTLGDVAGKGLGAALCMARIQATLHAIADDFSSLAALMARMNRIVCRDGLPTRFSTLVYAEIAAGSGTIRLVNAGHYPPIVLSGGKHEILKPGAPALGITKKSKYAEQKIHLRKGDALLIYSDGITDARNEKGVHFDDRRLLSLLPGLKNMTSEEMGKTVVGAVDRFIGEARPSDDLSLVIVRRTD
jgi:sigma-B regulation protein RsbU (phosphoserine phosphatase)